jgi:hypothetical protein
MEKVLSIYFSPERTYLALLEKTNNGLKLKKVGTTSCPIDLESLESPFNEESLNEMYEILSETINESDFLTVSIPMEYVILTQFPGRPNITKDEIMSVINIEIRQNYPQFNPDEFPTFLFELMPRKGQTYFLAAIIPKKIFQSIKKISNNINKLVERIEISQITAHNAFLYNYPEEKDNFVALFNISDKFIDYSIIKGNEFYFYNLIKYNLPDELPDLIDPSLSKLQNELNIKPSSLYFFGTHLTRIFLNNFISKYGTKFQNIKRLNSLRLVSSGFSDAERQICSRIAHHLPACIGAVIPEYHKKIKIY